MTGFACAVPSRDLQEALGRLWISRHVLFCAASRNWHAMTGVQSKSLRNLSGDTDQLAECACLFLATLL